MTEIEAVLSTTSRTLTALALFAGTVSGLTMMSHAYGEDAKPAVKVGDAAPDFTATDDQGKDWKSADHYKKNIVVVYFYPADMTGGCTKQACAFRDDFDTLKSEGVEVVGVSADSVANHKIFKKAHKLPFTLLADENGAVAGKFGVPYEAGEKTFKANIDGVETPLVRQGTSKRWTFIIDQDGKVAYKNDKVDAPNDSKKVQEVVKTLKK
jgi:peroxiredoxin Q/BCP